MCGAVALVLPMKIPAVATFGICLVLTACGWFDGPEEAVEPEGPRLVGRIASVHADQGFVLVQGFDELKLGEGLLLTTRGEDDRAASLVVTGERAGRYTAADLKGGSVEVGDPVFARPKAEEEAPEDPETQKNPPANP